jgi:hypothetical protein
MSTIPASPTMAEIMSGKFRRASIVKRTQEQLATEHARGNTDVIRVQCRGCDGPFYSDHRNQRYCSEACRIRAGKSRVKARAAAARRRRCEQCDRLFSPARSDAKFCGATCRQRSHRTEVRSLSTTGHP